jgi:mycothiol synthase
MADLNFRPYRPGDAAALTALYNAVEQHGGGHPGYIEDETAAVISSIVADPEPDTRLVFSPDGELIAAGVVATPPPGGFRIDAHGGVAPQWRGRGVGREVLGWQIERSREIHRAAGSPDGWVFEASALVADDAAVRLFERFGAKASRYYFEMVAAAKDDPRPLPDGLRVQTYEPQFERALFEAHTEAFSDHWGYQMRTFDQWTGFTVRSESFLADLSRLVFDGDELAAYVLSYDDADPDRVYIGQVGTRRAWRRRGLAGALLSDVLTGSAAIGKGHVYLEVDADSPTGAVGVYESAGFTTATRSVEYRLNL